MKVRIGIDPDIEKSGYAIIESKKVSIIDTIDFFSLIEAIGAADRKYGNDLTVCIEAGWLNEKTVFHMKTDKFGNKSEHNKGTTAKIAMYTGQNHAVGRLLEQYCIKNHIPYKLIKPTGKKWDAKLFKQITGWTGQSNQETRDAVRAAWV